MKFNDLSVRMRITIGMSLILLLSVISAVNTLIQNEQVKYETGEVAESWIPAIENLGYMKGYVAEHYLLVADRMATGSSAPDANFDSRLQKIESDLGKATGIYAATLETYRPGDPMGDKEKALYADYQKKRDTYFASVKEALTGLASATPDGPELQLAQELFARTGQSHFREAYTAMEGILKFNLEGTAGAARKAHDLVRQTETIMLVTTAVLIGLSALLIWWIPTSVTVPVNAAVQIAQRIAEGDLTHRITVDRKDELGHLLQRLNDMQNRLIDLVGGLRRSSQQVAHGAEEIEQGNHDLSSRTENQASALEQTAASMEELGSTVKQNAESAAEANQLVRQASDVAEQGGAVVSEVVQTMRGIHDSSREIGDIIGVIDSIAFQTNILALNAAVEAARAGEQGRGFAVVASEVRSLAGRSAEAAKQIKALITASAERVEKGTELVNRAGDTMHDVVESIQKVTHIMAQISAASQEQALGVQQITDAVGQIDQNTQQNAALVEEIAAAATSLKSQAQDLVQSAATFKLDEGDRAQAKALPGPR